MNALMTADEWILNKVAQQKKRNIDSTHIFAILKETEKAYYVMLSGDLKPLCSWLPKSTVKIANEEVTDSKHTLITADYEEAKKDFYFQWSFFR